MDRLEICTIIRRHEAGSENLQQKTPQGTTAQTYDETQPTNGMSSNYEYMIFRIDPTRSRIRNNMDRTGLLLISLVPVIVIVAVIGSSFPIAGPYVRVVIILVFVIPPS